jgi:homoserine dehydrogenase
MKSVNIILAGFGRVGRAFWEVVEGKRKVCRERYGLDLVLRAVFKSDGGIFRDTPISMEPSFPGAPLRIQESPDWKPSLRVQNIMGDLEPGVLVECTPSDLRTGEPGLSHLTAALENGWHAAAASKGALVLRFKELTGLARKNGLQLKFSGAAAAALPTLDVGIQSLAGADILGIEGILNGTTNFILTRMGEGMDSEQALKVAQDKGIAELDPTLDIDGWDTACKLLLISNAVMRTDFGLSEVQVEGIRGISHELVIKASRLGKAIKLMGKCSEDEQDHRWKLAVGLALLSPSHPLYGVNETTKGITFYTDTMGPVTVMGGKSDPLGTGAALLKDIIGIYADR